MRGLHGGAAKGMVRSKLRPWRADGVVASGCQGEQGREREADLISVSGMASLSPSRMVTWQISSAFKSKPIGVEQSCQGRFWIRRGDALGQ